MAVLRLHTKTPAAFKRQLQTKRTVINLPLTTFCPYLPRMSNYDLLETTSFIHMPEYGLLIKYTTYIEPSLRGNNLRCEGQHPCQRFRRIIYSAFWPGLIT
jgi:hypothetical protein